MAAVCVDNLDAERSLHDTRQNSVAKVTSQSNESFFRPETPDPESDIKTASHKSSFKALQLQFK